MILLPLTLLRCQKCQHTSFFSSNFLELSEIRQRSLFCSAFLCIRGNKLFCPEILGVYGGNLFLCRFLYDFSLFALCSSLFFYCTFLQFLGVRSGFARFRQAFFICNFVQVFAISLASLLVHLSFFVGISCLFLPCSIFLNDNQTADLYTKYRGFRKFSQLQDQIKQNTGGNRSLLRTISYTARMTSFDRFYISYISTNFNIYTHSFEDFQGFTH